MHKAQLLMLQIHLPMSKDVEQPEVRFDVTKFDKIAVDKALI